MKEKIDILKEYSLNKKLEIIIYNKDTVNSIPKNVIPTSWHEMFKNEKQNVITDIIQLWRNFFSEEFINIIKYFEEKLIDVDLIKIGQRYYILYVILTINNEKLYYVGGNPLEVTNEKNKLNGRWYELPNSVCKFYERVHNGFYDYCNKAMGLVDLESICCMNTDEWGIIEKLVEKLQINIDSSYSFFENGVGDYVVIDLDNCEKDKATVWFSDDQPEYNVNFWEVVDEWIVMGLED